MNSKPHKNPEKAPEKPHDSRPEEIHTPAQETTYTPETPMNQVYMDNDPTRLLIMRGRKPPKMSTRMISKVIAAGTLKTADYIYTATPLPEGGHRIRRTETEAHRRKEEKRRFEAAARFFDWSSVKATPPQFQPLDEIPLF